LDAHSILDPASGPVGFSSSCFSPFLYLPVNQPPNKGNNSKSVKNMRKGILGGGKAKDRTYQQEETKEGQQVLLQWQQESIPIQWNGRVNCIEVAKKPQLNIQTE